MPTGYTAAIKDGITFRQFALNCARAFGALVTMRDEPNDAPIPESFQPSDYHIKRIAEIEKELNDLRTLTDSEAEARARLEYDEELKRYEKALEEAFELKEKYLDMLKQVKAWQEPTPEHKEYKNFMIKQIEESIDFDCDTEYYTTPKLKSGGVWLSERLAGLVKDLEYHKEKNLKEVERATGRTEWVNALRSSLPSAQHSV